MSFSLELMVRLFCLGLAIAAPRALTSDPLPPGLKPGNCGLKPRNIPWSMMIKEGNNVTTQPTLELPSHLDFCRQVARFTIPLNHEVPYNIVLPSIRLIPPYVYWLVYELYGELQICGIATQRHDGELVIKRHVLAATGPYPVLDSWMYGTDEYSEVEFEISIFVEWEWKQLFISEIALYQIGPPNGDLHLNRANGSSNNTEGLSWQ